VRIEPRLDCADRTKAANHQPRANEQYERQRNLDYDQRAQQTSLPPAARRAFLPFLQRFDQLNAR